MKAVEDFLDSETFRAIKALSLPEMSRYLYAIYSSGYAAGLNDAGGEKLREVVQGLIEKVEAVRATAKKKYAPEGQEDNWA